MTVEEYFAADEKSEVRLEYLDGDVFPVGEPPLAEDSPIAHSRITAQLGAVLAKLLLGGHLRVELSVPVQVKSSKCLPADVAVSCGAQSPKAIFEILSPSTEGYDRGAKFELYETIETLEEYVLIEQHKPRIEVFTRATQGTWIRHAHTGLDAAAELKSLGITLPLAEVYADLFE